MELNLKTKFENKIIEFFSIYKLVTYLMNNIKQNSITSNNSQKENAF